MINGRGSQSCGSYSKQDTADEVENPEWRGTILKFDLFVLTPAASPVQQQDDHG
jgi:hypothetical protein